MLLDEYLNNLSFGIARGDYPQVCVLACLVAMREAGRAGLTDEQTKQLLHNVLSDSAGYLQSLSPSEH